MKRSPSSPNVASDSWHSYPELIPPDAKTVAYIRVSTEDQARGDAPSLPDQLRRAEAFAEERGRGIDAVVEDKASGQKLTRPGFQRLIAHCERHPRRGGDRGLVICLDNSRWGRFVTRPSLGQTFIDRLYLVGWDVQFTREPSTGNEDADVFLSAARSVASATEGRRFSYRARTGMVAQARAGHWLGKPPFGFDRLAVSETGKERRLAPRERAGKNERLKLTPGDSTDVRTVRLIFEMAAEGKGVEDIARELNRRKLPGPWARYPDGRVRKNGRRSAERWTGFGQVARILRNPAYCGQLRFWPKLDDNSGKRVAEPVVVEGAFEPLVDRDLWNRVQAVFSKPKRPRAAPGRYLLLGLLRCQCGEQFIGGGGTRDYVLSKKGTHVQVGGKRSRMFRPAKPGEKGTYVPVADREANRCYRCPNCKEPRTITLNKRWLEGRVIELVGKHVRKVLNDGSFDRVLNELLDKQRGKRQARRRDFEAEREQLKEERARVVQAIAKGILSEEDAKDLLAVNRSALELLEEERQRERFEDRGASVTAKERARLKQMARDFAKRIEKADVRTARELISSWVTEVNVDGSNPRKRTGRIVLRRVPVAQCSSQHSGGR